MKKHIVSKVTRVISIGVFLFSLTQQSFCTDNFCGTSIMDLFSGAIGIFLGGAALTWLANPLILMSWITYKKNPKLSLKCGALAFLISVSFLFFNKIVSDEAGNCRKIISYQLGYWLWVLSALVMFAGISLSFLFNKDM